MGIKRLTKFAGASVVLASVAGFATAADYPYEATGADWLAELPVYGYNSDSVGSVQDIDFINALNELVPAASGKANKATAVEEFPLAE